MTGYFKMVYLILQQGPVKPNIHTNHQSDIP